MCFASLWERKESYDDLFHPLPLSRKNNHAEKFVVVSKKCLCIAVEVHFKLECFILEKRLFVPGEQFYREDEDYLTTQTKTIQE